MASECLFLNSKSLFLLLSFLVVCIATPTPEVPRSLTRKDYVDDLYNFDGVAHLLDNLHTRIGIPFGAIKDVGLKKGEIMEAGLLDLSLLPNKQHLSQAAKIYENHMVEINEGQLIILCKESDAVLKRCHDQEHILKGFLTDLHDSGSRIAISKERMENSQIWVWDAVAEETIPASRRKTSWERFRENILTAARTLKTKATKKVNFGSVDNLAGPETTLPTETSTASSNTAPSSLLPEASPTALPSEDTTPSYPSQTVDDNDFVETIPSPEATTTVLASPGTSPSLSLPTFDEKPTSHLAEFFAFL